MPKGELLTANDLRLLKEFAPVAKMGLEMRRISEYQVRIAGRLDIFISTHRDPWSWHDIRLNTRGRIHTGSIKEFVTEQLARMLPDKPAPFTQIEVPSTRDAFEEGLEDLICACAPSKQIIEYVRAEIKRIQVAKV